MQLSSPTGGWDQSPANHSRRQAIALMIGMAGISSRLPGASTTLRVALSETVVSGVNINDARVAMQVWIRQMMMDLSVAVEISPRIFDTSEEIVRRARYGQFDVVALTTVEYRRIAEFLDAGLILAEAGPRATVEYLLLVKRANGATRLGDLRGRRLAILDNTRMCVAQAWLSNLLQESHLGSSDQFFASVTPEIKSSRVVLPVFFGQVDACLTSRAAFETMCELNPQVGRDLAVVANSPPVVSGLCAFHKDYHGEGREKLTRIYVSAPSTPAEQQLATLFEFRQLAPKDASYLKPTLAILDAADRVRHERPGGGRR